MVKKPPKDLAVMPLARTPPSKYVAPSKPFLSLFLSSYHSFIHSFIHSSNQ